MNGFQVKTLRRKLRNHDNKSFPLSDYDKSFVEDLLRRHELNNNFELLNKQNSYLNKIGGRSWLLYLKLKRIY